MSTKTDNDRHKLEADYQWLAFKIRPVVLIACITIPSFFGAYIYAANFDCRANFSNAQRERREFEDVEGNTRVHETGVLRAIHSLLMTSASVTQFRHSSRFMKPS
jgi:hypothetical protein